MQTDMAWITRLGILSYWWAIPSSILRVLIYKYIIQNPDARKQLINTITGSTQAVQIIRM